MQFLQELLQQRLFENRNMVPIAAHIEITTTKSIEACPEDLFVQKAVLGKDIQFFVGDECSSQKQLISRLIPQMVHGFGLRCTIFFDLMCLICYDKVGMKGKKVFLQSPCRFIIDNSDLQIIPVQLGKLFFFLCTAAFQNSQLIWKSSKTCKFLFPDRENRQWCCDQDSSDMTILIQNSNNGNAGDGLSAAHFHEQCHAITVCL